MQTMSISHGDQETKGVKGGERMEAQPRIKWI